MFIFNYPINIRKKSIPFLVLASLNDPNLKPGASRPCEIVR
jgi:hypothetical protein